MLPGSEVPVLAPHERSHVSRTRRNPSRRLLDGLAARQTRYWFPAFFAVVALLAYAAILPSGRWQGDEYFLVSLIHDHDWSSLVGHLRWAPRPITETGTWLYLYVANALDRPLAVEFLAALWAGCLIWIALIGWLGRERHPFTLAVVLFALTLLVSKPGEMFYWPDGAAAYLPCWAGLAGASVLQRSPGQNGVAMTACLLLAALSIEVGAVTVLIYAALVSAITWRDRLWGRLWPLVAPSICAVGVCFTVLHGRIQPMSEVIDPASGLAGHWGASLTAALPPFIDQCISIVGLPLLAGAMVKLLLLAVLPPHDGEGSGAGTGALWACALMVAVFLSQAIAFHEFGTQCCERHVTQRQTMVLLALLSLTGLRMPYTAHWRKLRPVGLAVILAGLLFMRATPLQADWHNQPRVLAARQRSWDSGRSPGDAMTLLTAPSGEIANADALPQGHFHACDASPNCAVPWYALGIMNFFGKRDLSIGSIQ